MTAPIYSPLPATLSIRLDGTPYPDDPPNADEFYRKLGTYMVAWGRFEGHLLSCLLMIRLLPGAPPEQKRFPVSFKGRAAYWRAAWKAIPILLPHAALADKLMIDIMDEAQKRNRLVHAFWREFIPANELTIRTLNVHPSSNSVTICSADLPIQAIAEAGIRANLLNVRLSQLSQVVSNLLPQTLPSAPKF